ncbi:hypothetical protein APF79_04820 [bacterium BRH_c32]|nr:MAG: hypothetical protein APF79_04820 [bacterium BRH_c32]
MTLTAFILLSIALILIVGSVAMKSDLFSPAKIFTIIWAITLGLAELKFSRLQHDWNGFGWLMLGVGIFSFLLGSFVVYVINYEKEIKPISSIRSSFKIYPIDKSKFRFIIIVIFSVYFLSLLGNYLIEGYLPLFHDNAAESRAFWGVFGIGLSVHAATSVIILAVGFLIIGKLKGKEKFLIILLIIISFISYLTLLQRFNLIFAIISAGIVTYYTSNAFRTRNVIFFFLIIFALMYSVQYLRTSSIVSAYLFNLAQMKIDPKYAVITEPYMYFAMNPENFVRAVNRIQEHTFGYYSFNFILSITGIKRMVTDYFVFNNFPFLNSSYNTYSAFWDYYRDFGIWGLSIIQFVLGFFISTVYYKLRTNPSIVNLMIYAICAFVITISFFVNTIGLLHFIFNSTLIIASAKYIEKTLVEKV